jgi:hypothetical protein
LIIAQWLQKDKGIFQKTMKLLICGKGGSGKSTVAALLAKGMQRRGRRWNLFAMLLKKQQILHLAVRIYFKTAVGVVLDKPGSKWGRESEKMHKTRQFSH